MRGLLARGASQSALARSVEHRLTCLDRLQRGIPISINEIAAGLCDMS